MSYLSPRSTPILASNFMAQSIATRFDFKPYCSIPREPWLPAPRSVSRRRALRKALASAGFFSAMKPPSISAVRLAFSNSGRASGAVGDEFGVGEGVVDEVLGGRLLRQQFGPGGRRQDGHRVVQHRGAAVDLLFDRQHHVFRAGDAADLWGDQLAHPALGRHRVLQGGGAAWRRCRQSQRCRACGL